MLWKASPRVLKGGKEKGERRDPLGETNGSCWNALCAPATRGGSYVNGHRSPCATHGLISYELDLNYLLISKRFSLKKI